MTDTIEPLLVNQSTNVKWDPSTQQQNNIDEDYDGGNSTARLFERTRIQVLAGKNNYNDKIKRN
jgi:hypothetical protein